MHPQFTVTNSFLPPPVSLEGDSHGESYAVASLFRKVGIDAYAAGSATASAQMRAKRGMTGLAAGAAAGQGDLTVFHPTVLHILVTGQSNSIGSESGSLVTTGPISGGFKFNGGMRPGSDPSSIESFSSLSEETTTVEGETGVAALVRWLKANVSNNAVYLISNEGVNAAPYNAIKKGTTPYNNHMAQVASAKAIAQALGLNYRVLCVLCVHGETDEQMSNTSYRTQLATWQSDYDSDVKAITSQTENIPMIHAVQGAYGAAGGNAGNLNASSAIQLMQAHMDNPAKVLIATPESSFDFYSHPHFTAYSHTWMGELFARTIKRACFDGLATTCIEPVSATALSSTQIEVTFNVPVPPLKFDYRFNQYSDTKGFRFMSTTGTAYPTSVVVSAPNKLLLNFASALGGTSQKVAYDIDDLATKVNRAANVVDSDATVGITGLPLHHRLAPFYLNVT